MQDDSEAIIAQLGKTDGLVQQPLQTLAMALRPVLNGGLAVVGFGSDDSCPGSCQDPVAQSPIKAVVARIMIQQSWQVQSSLQPDEQRDVVYSLVC